MVISTVSFRPPTLIGPYAAGSTSLRSGCPDWVLLYKSARISELRNATTAECHTKEGQAVEVSFWLVDPPGVSYFSVHCPGLKEDYFSDEPLVICAEAALVLFCVTLNIPHWSSTHYFVYRAGPGKPSLHLLPDPNVAAFRAQLFGLLPCVDADSEHYAVAFLDRKWITRDEAWQFDVYVFSSETQVWSRKMALLHLSESDKVLLDRHATFKQMTVGASSLGFVDLLRGILLLSNLFDKYPVIKYIQFPASRVCITDKDGRPYYALEYFCDVACCNDLIKFVEIEFDDPDCRTNDKGWKATTWNRNISWNNWCKRFTVDVAKIPVDQSYSSLLPELWDDKTEELELKKLFFYSPTLSMHDDDFLYMMSKVNHEDDKAWVITVDMKHAALEALAPFSTERCYHIIMYCPCAFPKYLNMTSEADMANPVDKYFKRMSVAHCVLQVLWTQDWFRELDQCLEFERSTYNECRSLLHCCPVSSLRFNIQAVVKYASYNGQGEAASKAVDFCLRALEDFDLLRRKSLCDPSTSIEAMRNKISVALRALDNILQIVPTTLMSREMALVDACHQKRGKAVFEDCEKPGHIKDYKLHGFPDAKLSHCKKPGHTKGTRRKRKKNTKDKSHKWQQGSFWLQALLVVSLAVAVSFVAGVVLDLKSYRPFRSIY